MSPPKGWKKFRVALTCEYCGKSFKLTLALAKGRRFCSRKCSAGWNKEHLTGIRLKPPEFRRCSLCDKKFEIRSNNRSQRFCSHSCFSKSCHLEQGHQLRDHNKLCTVCQKPIAPKNQKYCSRECMAQAFQKPSSIRQCEFCGEDFTITTRNPKQRFCSQSCFGKWNALQRGYKLRRFDRPCLICGNTSPPNNLKYCSRRCHSLSQKGKPSHNIIPEEDLVTELQRVASLLGGNPGRYKFVELSKYSLVPYERVYGSWVKAKEAILGVGAVRYTGENHPNWRGGWEPYYGPSWLSQRQKARERDKVCQRCSLTPGQNGRELDAHHIIPFRLFGRERHLEANHLDNLVCYCMSCHTIIDSEFRETESLT